MLYHKDSLVLVIMHVFVFHSTSLATNLEVPKVSLYLLVSLIIHAVREVSDVRVRNLADLDYVFMLQTHSEDCYPTKLGI